MFLRLTVTLGCVALCACGGGRKFSVKQTLHADSSNDVASATVLYDLSSVPEIAQDGPTKVTQLKCDSVVANISQIDSTNRASSMTLVLALRDQNAPTDASQDVVLGSLGPIPLLSGIDGSIGGTQQLDDFLLDEEKNKGGKFFLILTGMSDQEAHFTVDVTLDGEVSP